MNKKKSGLSSKPKDNNQTQHQTGNSILPDGGTMGTLIREKDWSKTPLKSIESWPQSLKTAVNIILTSRYPMFIWWGESLINLYNDKYVPFLGIKHPKALGQSAKDIWAEIWSQVGPRTEKVMKEKQATFDEALFLLIERYGYPEETYFMFSYSPMTNDEGGVDGLFCVCNEQTQQIVGERQLALLRDLAAKAADARTIEGACTISMSCLKNNNQDIPFAMMYFLDQDRKRLRLIGASGIKKSHQACPPVVTLGSNTNWPFGDVIASGHFRLINDLSLIFDDLPSGHWDIPPRQAIVIPTLQPDKTGQTALLIVGLNPYRPFNDDYQRFIELVNAQITSNIVNAKAYEEERKRVEVLAQIDKAKTLFFSNISHEFRTPLTLMLGPIEDALNDIYNASENKIRMEIAYRNALRLLKLVNTLLDFARIEAHRMDASFESVDIVAMTTDLASNFRSAIEKAGLKLTVTGEKFKHPVYIDKDMWEKIVLNLLSNAFKYTLKGSITVLLQQTARHSVKLTISDTGIGIPQKEIGKVFERFYRVKSIQGRTHEGTGIGLALVQELVKLHEGSIQVTSRVGSGTTFVVTIPFRKNHVTGENKDKSHPIDRKHTQAFVQESLSLISDESIAPPLEAKSQITPVGNIIVAEDNADMRSYISNILSPEYKILAFSNGQEALKAIMANPPDLILSDIMMPIMDGLELVKQVRNHTHVSHIPIILLSARAGQESVVSGLDSGADDYLVKPFAAKELLARIKQHITMFHLREEVANQKQQFISYITHELHNPLHAIVDSGELLHNGKYGLLPTKQAKPIGQMINSANYLLHLIDNLSSLAALETRKMQFIPEKIDLMVLITEVKQTLQPIIKKKNMVCTIDVSDEVLTVTLDPIRLKQVLHHYLDNALKFTPPPRSHYNQSFSPRARDVSNEYQRYWRWHKTRRYESPICRASSAQHNG